METKQQKSPKQIQTNQTNIQSKPKQQHKQRQEIFQTTFPVMLLIWFCLQLYVLLSYLHDSRNTKLVANHTSAAELIKIKFSLQTEFSIKDSMDNSIMPPHYSLTWTGCVFYVFLMVYSVSILGSFGLCPTSHFRVYIDAVSGNDAIDM